MSVLVLYMFLHCMLMWAYYNFQEIGIVHIPVCVCSSNGRFLKKFIGHWLINPCYRVFLEKFLVSQLVNSSLLLCKPKTVFTKTLCWFSRIHMFHLLFDRGWCVRRAPVCCWWSWWLELLKHCWTLGSSSSTVELCGTYVYSSVHCWCSCTQWQVS
jgi:hypothetical protein